MHGLTAESAASRIGALNTDALTICRSNPRQGIALAAEALALALEHALPLETAQAMACKGACEVWIGEYDSALKNLFQALPVLLAHNDHHYSASAYYHTFCAFYFLADYDNALKYAYDPGETGEVRIALAQAADGRLQLAVEDDGRGMGQAPAPHGTGLGQKVVAAMARSLDTALEFDPSHRGVRAVLSFAP